MAPQKSLKKCQSPECVDVGDPDGCDWDSISYRGHPAYVHAESTPTSFPSVSPDAIATASDDISRYCYQHTNYTTIYMTIYITSP